MGELYGDAEFHANIKNFSPGGKDLLCVRTNMCGNHFTAAAARARSGDDLLAVRAGRISHPIRHAKTAAHKRTIYPCVYQFALSSCRRRIAIHYTGTPAKIGVPCEHTYIYSSSVLINDIQIICRIAAVVAAVSTEGRGHAHAQHAVKDRALCICVDSTILNGVFMHMYVDKTGTNDLAGCVNALIRIRHILRNRCHTPVFYQYIEMGIDPVCRVYEMSAVNKSSQSTAPSWFLWDYYKGIFCTVNRR